MHFISGVCRALCLFANNRVLQSGIWLAGFVNSTVHRRLRCIFAARMERRLKITRHTKLFLKVERVELK